MLLAASATGRRRLGPGGTTLLRFGLSQSEDDCDSRLKARLLEWKKQQLGVWVCARGKLPTHPLTRPWHTPYNAAYHISAWALERRHWKRRKYFRPCGAHVTQRMQNPPSSSSSTGRGPQSRRPLDKPSGAPPYDSTKRPTSKQVKEKSEHVVKLALGGNVVITIAKFLAWLHSGSSAMLSESIHSLVDSGNQTLLLIGIRAAATAPDRHHQYGYGKSIYFWSLVSALGTFWLGAGVSLRNSFQDLMSPTVQLEEITWDVWGVLGVSFLIDGSVLYQTMQLLRDSKPKHLTLWEHIRRIRDPTTLAVLLEDSGACLGVVMAIVGIGLSHALANPVYDSIGGLCISSLLAAMGLALARLNERYLLGQAVEPEIVEDIRKLLMARPGIDNVQSVQSQWIGPYTFAYKAEVDFDGTYLAAKLMARYEDEFLGSARLKEDLPVLLAFYAEDVVRTLEREVRDVEREIRAVHPEAQFIELEPASKDATAFAIDGHREKMLRELEHITLNQLLIAIAKNVVKQQQKQKHTAKQGQVAATRGDAGAGETSQVGDGKGSEDVDVKGEGNSQKK